MTNFGPCKKHYLYTCTDPLCVAERNSTGNAGQLAFDSSGPSIGIGGGLTIDPADGSLGISMGGFNIDFDGH